ncbi:MAG TPA: GspH/FimT family pseudopilin [Crinalium sp.]|jgi:prepilin-type N-terminal cleavage/methylation domain-containing protein
MKNPSFQRQSTAGFTLLEVLVVVVMIAILFAIAGPGWLGVVNRQRSASSREQILQAIRLAQSEAIRTKREQTVTFDAVANPPTITVKGATEQLGNGKFRTGMVSLQTTAPSITFDADGNIKDGVTPPVVITVRAPANTGKRRCVIIQTILGATRSAEDGEALCP